MNKQHIRQLQKSGNGFSVRVPPEVREDLQVNKQGDNVAWERDSDSGDWKFSKVAQPNPGDETRQNIETESGVDNETQSQQPELKFEFCAKCGSPNIDVTGNKYHCHKCDVLYEFSAEGVIAVELGPLAEDVEEVKSQLANIGQEFHQLVGELNDHFGNGSFSNGNENPGDSEPKEKTGLVKNIVETVTFGLVGIHYVDKKDEDEDEDEE